MLERADAPRSHGPHLAFQLGFLKMGTDLDGSANVGWDASYYTHGYTKHLAELNPKQNCGYGAICVQAESRVLATTKNAFYLMFFIDVLV